MLPRKITQKVFRAAFFLLLLLRLTTLLKAFKFKYLRDFFLSLFSYKFISYK